MTYEKIEEANCPRCGNRALLPAAADTASDATIKDYTCAMCDYSFDWREGSEYPKSERAAAREAAASEPAPEPPAPEEDPDNPA